MRGFCDAEKGKRGKERAVSGGFFGLLESVFDRDSRQNANSCDSETIGRREWVVACLRLHGRIFGVAWGRFWGGWKSGE